MHAHTPGYMHTPLDACTQAEMNAEIGGIAAIKGCGCEHAKAKMEPAVSQIVFGRLENPSRSASSTRSRYYPLNHTSCVHASSRCVHASSRCVHASPTCVHATSRNYFFCSNVRTNIFMRGIGGEDGGGEFGPGPSVNTICRKISLLPNSWYNRVSSCNQVCACNSKVCACNFKVCACNGKVCTCKCQSVCMQQVRVCACMWVDAHTFRDIFDII